MPAPSPTSLRRGSSCVIGAVALVLFVLLGLRAALVPAPAATGHHPAPVHETVADWDRHQDVAAVRG